MKIRRSAATAAAAVLAATTSVNAQVAYGSSSSSSSMTSMAMSMSTSMTASTSYMTVTYDDCPSISMQQMITVTKGTTITYCPTCEWAAESSSIPGYTTIYTTTYMSLCPTGVVPMTYTVTESCTNSAPTWTPGPSHIPQGFTVTTKACTVCGESTSAVTVTEPCGCNAHEGTIHPATTPAAPPAAPSGGVVSQINDGQIQAPGPAGSAATPTAGSGSGKAPAGSSPNSAGGEAPAANISPAPSAGGSGATMAPYPTATTTTEKCPGPACRALASSYPSGVSPGNTTGIEQSTGAGASLISPGLLSSFALAVAAAGLAFAL